ncbi:LOW QUALITY PROTEIN: uncharacterized protein ACRADG_009753 [Cochliomyia hominivorax]
MLKVNIINYMSVINCIIYFTVGKLEVNFFLKYLEEENMVKSLVNLIKQVKKEQNFDYILLINGVNNTAAATTLETCLFSEIVKWLDIPSILLDTQNLESLSATKHSTNVLILSCHYLDYNNEYWFAKPYQLNRFIIFAKSHEIIEICQLLRKFEIYEAIIVKPDFAQRNTYKKCQMTTEKEQEKSSEVLTEVFEEHKLIFNYLKYGIQEVSTHPDQMLPRSFVYVNDKGDIKMDGYVGNILETFAERVKASLVYKYPIERGIKTFFEILENRTLEGILDVATGVRPVYDDLINLAYPVEFMDFCYMIPLPHYVAINKLFFIVVDFKTMLIILSLMYIYALLITLAVYGSTKYLTFINLFLNDKSIRGILGQSFILPQNSRFLLKFICFLICFTSIMLNTAYQAYLQSYFTQPPYQQLVRSYDDIRQAGLHIMASTRELKYLNPVIVESYKDIFIFFENYEKYVEQREEMDTQYVYTVTRPLWSVYHEKQKLFECPMYYYSSHLCLKDLFLVAMPVRPGWPYRDLFNRHIMQLRDVGLMELWTSNTFNTMLKFGYTNFEDLSSSDMTEETIILHDLLWIWVIYLVLNGLATLVFVGELFVMKFYRVNE